MMGKHQTGLRIVLCAGLFLLVACASRSTPASVQTVSGGQCGQNEDTCNVLGGYYGNVTAANIIGATISGGGVRGTPNQVTGNYATVSGGEGNLASEGSTVAGGSGNTAIHFYAFVGGGSNNVADGQEATVAGGFKNIASERFAIVGGGSGNVASDINATVSGGSGNVANYRWTTIGGGTQNLASNVASVVSGGDHNLAQGAYSAILGGINNAANGYITTIGGGVGNLANGSYAVVPGGFANAAGGDYSFAAGRSAQVDANHPGVFLFADASPFVFPSMTANEFAVRSTGGVRFITGLDASGSASSGVRLSAGSGAWETLSDYHAKAGIAPVDGRQVLERLASLTISTWSYRSQDSSIRHMGPMAQDFYAAFQLGEDERYISTVDADGVTLAAIQELYHMVQQKDSTVTTASQDRKIISLEKRLGFSNWLTIASFLIATLAWKRTAIAKS